jgi:SAM-dependent methyltransferase
MPDFDRNKWNAKYAAGEMASREPSAVLVGLDRLLPRTGRAIDVAGGAGRHGIWLASRGLDVTIADISPVGLAIARERAAEAGLPVRQGGHLAPRDGLVSRSETATMGIETVEIDIQERPFPAGPWDLIVSVCYLWRPIFAAYPEALAPGGTLAVIQPTKRNLERHEKPPFDFLLDDGELPSLVRGLEIVHYEEGWLADDRHDACLVARKPA